MGEIKKLYGALKEDFPVSYLSIGPLKVKHGGGHVPTQVERIVVTFFGEQLSIIYFGDRSLPTRVTYYAHDPQKAAQTFAEMNLPSSRPDDLGDRVLYDLNSQLSMRERKDRQGVAVQVESEQEDFLEAVLKKFIRAHSDKRSKE